MIRSKDTDILLYFKEIEVYYTQKDLLESIWETSCGAEPWIQVFWLLSASVAVSSWLSCDTSDCHACLTLTHLSALSALYNTLTCLLSPTPSHSVGPSSLPYHHFLPNPASHRDNVMMLKDQATRSLLPGPELWDHPTVQHMYSISLCLPDSTTQWSIWQKEGARSKMTIFWLYRCCPNFYDFPQRKHIRNSVLN